MIAVAARTIGIGLLLAGLAGCADAGAGNDNAGAAAPANASANAAAGTNAQLAVRELPEGQRNGVLFRAIRDARQPCQNVRESMLSETPGRTPVYMATCENNAVYAVAIRDDGNAIVRPVMPPEENKQ